MISWLIEGALLLPLLLLDGLFAIAVVAGVVKAIRAAWPCAFRHDKAWVAIRFTGSCPCIYHNGRAFVARWVCRRCPQMGEKCLGRNGGGMDWKIEHEQLVPDQKRWANWGKD